MNNNNRIEDLVPKQMDENWEMNMHLNPIDSETADIIKQHKNLMLNGTDDFV